MDEATLREGLRRFAAAITDLDKQPEQCKDIEGSVDA